LKLLRVIYNLSRGEELLGEELLKTEYTVKNPHLNNNRSYK
jgi:hypothetical protein